MSILIAALMSAASSAQVKVSQASVNPEMSKLFEELTQLGRAPMVQKTGGMGQWGNPPQLNYSVWLWFRPDLWYSRQRKEEPSVLDSLLRAEKTSFEKQVKAIRRTLDKLAKEAQDKSLYDNHKSGKDTIYYALNLSHDTTRVYKLQEGNHTYYNSDEFLDFVLESAKQEGTFEGRLSYTVSLPRVNPGATSDLYSWHSLKEDIARLMDEHGVGHRDALWQHDMAYSDSIWEEENREWIHKGYAGDHNNAGLTEATIYSVPEANKPLARARSKQAACRQAARQDRQLGTEVHRPTAGVLLSIQLWRILRWLYSRIATHICPQHTGRQLHPSPTCRRQVSLPCP